MPTNPLAIFEQHDPDLLAQLGSGRELAFGEGAVPVKYKLLMALAIDAAHGAADGVRSLAKTALDNGATKEEVLEAVRVAAFVSGAGALYTAARGLDGVV